MQRKKSKSKVKLNFGLSPDFSIKLNVSLSESLSERISQKLKWPNLSAVGLPPELRRRVSVNGPSQGNNTIALFLCDGPQTWIGLSGVELLDVLTFNTAVEKF